MSPEQIEELKRDLRNCAVQPAGGINDPSHQARIWLLRMFRHTIAYIDALEADKRRLDWLVKGRHISDMDLADLGEARGVTVLAGRREIDQAMGDGS